MNFLQLCQRLKTESGLSGTGPASVVGQTGDNLRIVNWIQSANTDVQNLHTEWKFLQTDFTFPTVAATQEYTPTEAGLSDLKRWKFTDWGDIRCYQSTSDEQYLDHYSWPDFKNTYLFGSSRDTTAKPTCFSIKPDKSIIFYPIPNAVYTINGEYWEKPEELSGNADTPNFPSEFHMILVWKALVDYGGFDAADERYVHGNNRYNQLLTALEIDQAPNITWGPPLA